MASVNQYPPVVPPPAPVPPQYPYRRSIAGPLILIIIGGLFLARNLGWHFPIWRWFGHWWPVLLILWGVIILVERTAANRGGYRRRGLGGVGVVLLVLLVVAGVSAHYSSDVDWHGMREQMQMDDDIGPFFGGNAYTFDETVEQSFPAKGTLRVVSDRGSINITAGSEDTIRVVVHKTLYADNQKDADKYNEGSKPQLTVNGDAVLLNANTNGAGNHNVETNLDISVPPGAMVDIAGKRGDVSITERKADVKMSLQKGDISLNQIGGAVNVSLEKGSIRATQITGDVDISGHVDDVSLDDVSGAVRLNGDFYEDVRLSKIAKSVIFKTSRSDMEIASVPGELDISSDEVRGNQLLGPTRVSTNSKSIHLEDISGDLQVQSNNGDVEVTTADKQPASKMSVTTQHGDVALTLGTKSAPEKVNVATQHGDVTLTLAPGAGFQINAGTRRGDISSDFDAVKVSQQNGSSQATGTVGNGNSKLQVGTDTGDIRIVKS